MEMVKMARKDCTGAEKGVVTELNSTTVSGAGAASLFESTTVQLRSGLRSWRAYASDAA